VTGKQLYWQAVTKAKLQGKRNLRRYLEGKDPYVQCTDDLERQALINAFNQLLQKQTVAQCIPR
jgi:molybdopterin/thiamine biosynthesis adenylyltransferase